MINVNVTAHVRFVINKNQTKFPKTGQIVPLWARHEDCNATAADEIKTYLPQNAKLKIQMHKQMKKKKSKCRNELLTEIVCVVYTATSG